MELTISTPSFRSDETLMSDPSPSPITKLLEDTRAGDPVAAAELLPRVYSELRRLARGMMGRLPPGQTLEATALVHEAYLKLVGRDDPGWTNRRHFLAIAAQAMREILVKEYRRKIALKRGGDRKRVALNEELVSLEPPEGNLLALDEALDKLENEDPRKAKIVLLRFFVGLKMSEIAEVLEVSKATVEREWRYLRVWLQTELTDEA